MLKLLILDTGSGSVRVGGGVRQTIKGIGGVLSEQLSPERHIKEVKKEIKHLEKIE